MLKSTHLTSGCRRSLRPPLSHFIYFPPLHPCLPPPPPTILQPCFSSLLETSTPSTYSEGPSTRFKRESRGPRHLLSPSLPYGLLCTMVRDILSRMTGSSSSSGQNQNSRNGNTSREDRYRQYQGYVPPTVTWSVSNNPAPVRTPAPRPVHSFGFGFLDGYGFDYDRLPVTRSPSHVTQPVPIPNHFHARRGPF
jgi:hypothetical protein